ncbi:hypothetical protein M422DRAFT_777374 [Sphaerobolus stellatus SS14]|nr:hypothetical protein M422DRAFT_777374 [Sphaerobolus stellatus SS14]
MSPSIFSRHPRYALALAVGFLMLILLGASHRSDIGYPPSRLHHKLHSSLRSFLEEAENDYQRVIGRRKELIRKFGQGDVKNMLPFPTNGDFYTLWDFWLPAFRCPHKMERLGTLGDGGKYVCGIERLAKKPDCVVYSVGINGESSFEAAILERTSGCKVWGYDFSVQSFGPEITHYSSLNSRAHFKPWGLSGVDAHGPEDSIKMYTLDTLMKLNGHKFIDILKIDIEGAEFDALTDLISHYSSLDPPQNLPFGQLQLEIHARDNWGSDLGKLLKWWRMLEKAGLRPFMTEPNLVYLNVYRGGQPPELAEYSFINIRGEHELTSDVEGN